MRNIKKLSAKELLENFELVIRENCLEEGIKLQFSQEKLESEILSRMGEDLEEEIEDETDLFDELEDVQFSDELEEDY